MNTKRLLAVAAMMILGASTMPLLAAEDYATALQAGEAHRRAGRTDEALMAFDQACAAAANDTQRGLALSKTAHVHAYDRKDYAAARQAAEKALALEGTEPVARVTALQVLALCQMKKDTDFSAAAETLARAMDLPGVDWAQPTLTMLLGDCYRLSERPWQALLAYRRVLALPDVPKGTQAIAWLNLGITYQYNLKDAEKAKAAYDKAVELNPALKRNVDAHRAEK